MTIKRDYPLNEVLHDSLLARGFAHTYNESDVQDNGGCESGPMPVECPAFDEYVTETHRVVVTEDGVQCDEPRDAALERWMEEQISNMVANDYGTEEGSSL